MAMRCLGRENLGDSLEIKKRKIALGGKRGPKVIYETSLNKTRSAALDEGKEMSSTDI